MGLEKCKFSRWRFTWQGRTIPRGNRRVVVVGPSKDQGEHGEEGKCVPYSISMVLEAHVKLNLNKDVIVPPDTLASDLKNFEGLENKTSTVWHACHFLSKTGALGFDSSQGNAEERYKFSFHSLDMHIFKDISWALWWYMHRGPMVGVFAIHGDDMETYGQTELDEIYFVSKGTPKAHHSVALPGFGVASIHPLPKQLQLIVAWTCSWIWTIVCTPFTGAIWFGAELGRSNGELLSWICI